MKKLAMIFSILVFAGCTTVEYVRKDQTPEKKAVLRYSPQSNPKKEAKHRDKLNKQARDYCGGDFTVSREYQALEETGGSTGVGTGFGFGRGVGIMIGGGSRNRQMYQFVEVACQSAPAAAPSPSPTPGK